MATRWMSSENFREQSVSTLVVNSIYCNWAKSLCTVNRSPVSAAAFGRFGSRIGAARSEFFYVVRRRDGIHVLHAFQKKTQKTRKSDIELGRSRYHDLQRKK